MNAIKLLQADHKKMKKLLKQLCQTKESAVQTRKNLFNIIKYEAKFHEKMEELFLYSLLRENKKTRPNALEHHVEVALMEHMIKELSKGSVNTEKWTAQFTVFKELNDHHIEEEEDEKFPQAIKIISKDVLDDIGNEMLLYKKKHHKG